MAETPPTRPAPEPDEASLEPDAQAYLELRQLILAPEQEALERLHQRVDDPASRTADVGSVVAEAIQLRRKQGGDEALSVALAPTIETALRESVRKDPTTLADALFPVRGLAISAGTQWVTAFIVTTTFPGLLSTVGLSGIFGIYTVVHKVALSHASSRRELLKMRKDLREDLKGLEKIDLQPDALHGEVEHIEDDLRKSIEHLDDIEADLHFRIPQSFQIVQPRLGKQALLAGVHGSGDVARPLCASPPPASAACAMACAFSGASPERELTRITSSGVSWKIRSKRSGSAR